MPTPDTINKLIRLVYECEVDPALWPVFLEEYARTVNAAMAALIVQDLRNQAGSIRVAYGLDPFWARRYAEYYAGVNVWAHRAGSTLRPGAVTAGEEFVSDASLMKTEFYADFLRPQQYFYSFGGTISRNDSVASYLTAARSRHQGPLEEAERNVVVQLMPHFETALRVHHRFAGVETRLEHTTGALDSLPHGVIVADAAGAVLFMNRQAEQMLGLDGTPGIGGLKIGKDGLRAELAGETVRLRELMARASETVAGNGAHAGGAMVISRAEGRAPLQMLVAPLPADSGFSTGRRGTVVVFVTAPEQVEAPGASQLKQLLGLTPAEARLASALVAGKTLQEFAEEAGIRYTTARTHLQRVFGKAGVSRQSELIRLALTAAGGSKRRSEK
jgi:DNA-binding CsgD family transcriptional regulator/PAS domain-containing protein